MSEMGKVALVTGGAQGLGKAFCQELLERGASVALMDLNETVGEATKKEFQESYGQDRVAFFKGNVTSQDGFEAVFRQTKEKFQGLDIVINNAGIGGEAPGQWERTIDINVNGTIRGTLLGIEHLRKDKGGRGGVIVNVASLAGIRPNPCSPAYCASKSAIIQYSLCWAINPDVAPNGVRINVLAPAFVDTPLVTKLIQGESCMLPQLVDKIVEAAGVMTVDTVAEAMMELVDKEQGKNGQVLRISKYGGTSYQPTAC